MTRWLDPLELAATAWSVVRARRSDRARESMIAGPGPTHDYSDDLDEGGLWFDYVADLGDAFDPTMAIAWTVGRQSIDPTSSNSESIALPGDGLPRGRFLVFGGDEVYPYASRRRYANQLVGPYSHAWEPGGDSVRPADVYALPGNHDWYGRPGAFAEVFLQKQPFGDWQTSQTASWFALRLPGGWWLWALDTGLDGTINGAQKDYFTAIATTLGDEDRIILCTPVPLWALAAKHPDDLKVIDDFVADVIVDPMRVGLWLSGDTHMFAAWNRNVGGRKVPHVTSGGGGAFLHPTHHLVTNQTIGGNHPFSLQWCWPRPDASEQLAAPWWKLLTDRQSRLLLPLVGALHLCFFGLVWGSFDPGPITSTIDARGPLAPVVSDIGAWVLAVGYIVALVAALEPNNLTPALGKVVRRWAALLGAVEALILLATGAASGLLVSAAASTRSGGLALAVVGSLVGAAASFAAFAAVVRAGNHRVSLADNLVFAAAPSEQYKHFVRCQITPDGTLNVFAVGIQDPGRGWDSVLDGGHAPAEANTLTYLWGKRIR